MRPPDWPQYRPPATPETDFFRLAQDCGAPVFPSLCPPPPPQLYTITGSATVKHVNGDIVMRVNGLY